MFRPELCSRPTRHDVVICVSRPQSAVSTVAIGIRLTFHIAIFYPSEMQNVVSDVPNRIVAR